MRWWLWNKLTKLGWADSVGNVGLETSVGVKQVGVLVEVRKVKLCVTRIRSVLRKGRSEVSFQKTETLEKSGSELTTENIEMRNSKPSSADVFGLVLVEFFDFFFMHVAYGLCC